MQLRLSTYGAIIAIAFGLGPIAFAKAHELYKSSAEMQLSSQTAEYLADVRTELKHKREHTIALRPNQVLNIGDKLNTHVPPGGKGPRVVRATIAPGEAMYPPYVYRVDEKTGVILEVFHNKDAWSKK